MGHGDAVEVEDELREQLAVVALPLPNGLEVVGGSLHRLLRRDLVLTGGLELPRQGSWLGAAPTDQAMASGFGVVDLDLLLLQRGLPVADIALLAGVGSLTLAAEGWSTKR